jgi:HK97 family phage major capsid protein
MKLKMSAAELEQVKEVLEMVRKANTGDVEAQKTVKNLIAKNDVAKRINNETEKSITTKWYEALATGDLSKKAVTEAGVGGNLVPVEVSNELLMLIPQYGFAASICNIKKMKSNTMRVTSLGGISISWFTEAGAFTTESGLTLTALNLTTGKMIAGHIFSNEEFEDAVVDIADMIRTALAAGISRELDRLIFLGQAGVFTGLKTIAGVGAVTVANAGTDQVVADAIIDLQTAVGPYAAAKGVYVTSLAGWGKMKKLKGTDGHYLARGKAMPILDSRDNSPFSGKSGGTDNLVGYFDEREVYVLENLDTFGTVGNVPVFYGDFKFMILGLRYNDLRVDILKEGTFANVSLASTDQQAVRAISRVAANCVPAAFARLSIV